MNTLRDNINETIKCENIIDIDFVRLNHWEWILDKLANAFLSNGKQSLSKIWLWEELKTPYTPLNEKDGWSLLKETLNNDFLYWFIASDEDGKYWVMDGKGASIIRLIENGQCFEYYIIDKKFNWMLCENHHGQIYAAGEIRENVGSA